MATKRHYVYLHRRADDGVVFYVGKGFGKRAWKKVTRSEWWKRIVEKHGRTVEIYKDDLDEVDAFRLEAELISKYGRAALCNLTAGGEGGVNPSAETRAKMSASRKGKPFSESHLANMKNARALVKISDETKAKISATLMGRVGKKHSEASKALLSKKLKGKVFTPEHCAKISASEIGKTGAKRSAAECEAIRLRTLGHEVSDETRKKIGDANRGRKHSESTIAVLTESNKRLNEARRLPILCSNGMIFEYSGAAEKWLRENGRATASRANIVSCCQGKLKTAYGFTWSRTLATSAS